MSICVRVATMLAMAMTGTVVQASADSITYTLYRDSVTGPGMRLHVATFDSREGLRYNQENCGQAQELFQAQPRVKTRFWCEPGRFRPAPTNPNPEMSKQFTTGTSEPLRCNPSGSELAKPKASQKPVTYDCK